MNKILMICMRSPYPPYGGEKIALYNFINYYKFKNYSIDAIIITDEHVGSPAQIKEGLGLQEVFVCYIPRIIRIFFSFVSALRIRPFQMGYFSNPYSRKKVQRRNFSDYSMIFLQNIRLHGILEKEYLQRTILYAADSMFANYRSTGKFLHGIQKIVYTWETGLMKEEERRITGYYNKTIFHSNIDVISLGLDTRKNVYIVPITRKQISDFRPVSEFTRRRFLFIANYRSKPNMIGVEFFLTHKNLFVENTIAVDFIGPNMPKKILNRIDGPFTYTGISTNLDEEIIDSYGVICPIFCGAGMQNKIIDALACGRPSIASDFSFSPYKKFLNNDGVYEFHTVHELIFQLKSILDKTDINQICISAYENSRKLTYENFESFMKPLSEL